MNQNPPTSVRDPARYVRIIAIPPGEAPLWVREKWLGLELPIADGRSAAQQSYISGVLSGPRNRFFAIIQRLLGRLEQQTGYPVYVDDALAILEKTAPDAASWWRANVPRLQQPKRKLLFRARFCEPVDAATNEMPAPPLPQSSAAGSHNPATSPVPHIPMREAAPAAAATAQD